MKTLVKLVTQLVLLLVLLLVGSSTLAQSPFATITVPKDVTECNRFIYRAKITSVYDGDTCTATVDLGFRVAVVDEKFRLYGIDAWEVKSRADKTITKGDSDKGKAARDWLKAQVEGKTVFVQTLETPKGTDAKEKFGRYLVVLLLPDGKGGLRNVNDELVRLGHAKYWIP